MSNPLLTALAVRSDFSLGESSLQLDKIIDQAKAHGLTHVALTDYMTVSAMPVFAEKAKKAGITPLVGCVLQLVDDVSLQDSKRKDKDNNPFRLKVYVKDDEGLRSLFAVLTKSLQPGNFYYKARLELADVLAMKGVIVTTADQLGPWRHPAREQILTTLTRTFGDDFYVELVAVNTPFFDRQNQLAAEFCAAQGVKAIVTRPAYYATGDDAESTDVLRAICSNEPMSSKWLARPFARDLFMMPGSAMLAQVKDMSTRLNTVFSARQAMLNVAELVGKCTYVFTKQAPSMPQMAPDEFVALVAAVRAGWKQRFSTEVWGHRPSTAELASTYKDRLAFELATLKKLGFSGYFLLVQDIVNWSKGQGIRVGPGRGSVGGSLVAYLMGITDIDPVRFGLLFERFINPDRLDLPDADLDFMGGRRHEVIDYIIGKYGRENVAGIVNFSTLGPASALRDSARMFELDPWEYNCSKQMEKEHGVSLSLTESAERVPDIQKFSESWPHVWNHALRLEGANRSLSQHAAGVVVAGEPVVNRAVVSGRNEALPVVQWDKTQVENFGLIKIDILGLNTLDLIQTALNYIRERHHKVIDLEALPLDDTRVLEAFGRAETTGVFQFTGGGMKKLLKDLAENEPLTFDDICAATALFRPGPLDAGLCDRYVQIKQGNMAPHYDHPILEGVLKETYGVLTYQEQIMQMCRELAGFTPGEADGVRKAMGKKDHDKMAEYEGRFVDGALAAGMTEFAARQLWSTTAGFAGYAFNKSHSYEYTLISWITMWLKVYYPAEFFAAAMTVIDKDDQLAGLVADAQARGLQVLPPEINTSSSRIEIEGTSKLYAPFQAIKGISGNVAAAIVQLREANGGGFGVDLTGVDPVIVGMRPAEQKVVLGRTKVNSAHMDKLRQVGAFWALDKVGHPPTHPDRLKARIELMPGFTVDMVKPTRGLTLDELNKIAITECISKLRTCGGCSLSGKVHPLPRFGKKPRFMLVFDSPNWQDEKAGLMMNGSAGDVVKSALADVGLNVADGYFTALVKAVKPNGQKALTNEQINGCSHWLQQEIEILKPPVIIAMGSNAVRYFAPGMKGTPSDLAGKVVYRKDLDASIIFGINPGMIYHDASKIKFVEATFGKLSELLS